MSQTLNEDLEFFSRPVAISPERRHRSREAPGANKALGPKLQTREKNMTKFLMATAAILALNIAAANANGYRADQRAVSVNSDVDQSYVSFGGRHQRQYRRVPWYAYSESGHCFVWTPNAYHYACDPNARY
jgi:hypothetical protein